MMARPNGVKALDGTWLLLSDLPPVGKKVRWTMNRKAQLLAALRGGMLTFQEITDRYRIDAAELSEWSDAFDRFGFRGLQATKLQKLYQEDA